MPTGGHNEIGIEGFQDADHVREPRSRDRPERYCLVDAARPPSRKRATQGFRFAQSHKRTSPNIGDQIIDLLRQDRIARVELNVVVPDRRRSNEDSCPTCKPLYGYNIVHDALSSFELCSPLAQSNREAGASISETGSYAARFPLGGLTGFENSSTPSSIRP